MDINRNINVELKSLHENKNVLCCFDYDSQVWTKIPQTKCLKNPYFMFNSKIFAFGAELTSPAPYPPPQHRLSVSILRRETVKSDIGLVPNPHLLNQATKQMWTRTCCFIKVHMKRTLIGKMNMQIVERRHTANTMKRHKGTFFLAAWSQRKG